jgi:hypothetical protein
MLAKVLVKNTGQTLVKLLVKILVKSMNHFLGAQGFDFVSDGVAGATGGATYVAW